MLAFLFMSPITADAAVGDIFTADGITYQVVAETGMAGGAVQVSRGTHGPAININAKTVAIPETVENDGTTYDVTGIGDSAFDGCTALTEVAIPDSVASIGNSAFANCSSLTGVVIPDSVASIGNSAFAKCTGMTSVVISNSVTGFGNESFAYCTGLKSIVIPDSVTRIDNGAFAHCSGLTEIVFPSAVTVISGSAFSYCTGLTEIVIPDSVTNIGDSAFYGCTGLTSVVIPDSVTNIGYCAFYSCTRLTSVIIPDSVTAIGQAAFYYCTGLKSVDIGDSVTIIDMNAFALCSGLTGVVIPDSVISIDPGAFSYCTGLRTVIFGDRVRSIGNLAFYGCVSLQSIILQNNIAPNVGIDAFGGQVLQRAALISRSGVGFPSLFGEWYGFVIGYYDTLALNVSFVDWDGTVLSSQSVAYGSGASAPADPHRDGYVFQGWSGAFGKITHALTLVAQYGADSKISLDVNGTYAFSSAPAGYGAAPKAKAVIVGNVGTGPTGALAIALSGLGADAFSLSKTLIDSIAENGSDSFSVAPVAGLPVGTYIATVTVSAAGSGGTSSVAQSFEVSFAVEPLSQSGLAVSVSSVTASPGDSVTVAVSAESSLGVAGFTLDVEYDQARLTLAEVDADSLGGQYVVGQGQAGRSRIVWVGDAPITADGPLYYITFIVADDAADGAAQLTISGDLADKSGDMLDAAFRGGQIDIVNFTYGQINGDDKIDISDVVLLKSYLLGDIEFTPRQLRAADVNRDGVVAAADLLMLMKYIAGGYDVELGKPVTT
jgi:hypothetical protein